MKTDTLAELRAELESRGYFRERLGRIVAELGLHVAIALSGVALFALADSWLVKLAGIFVLTAGSMGIATNCHTASHGAASSRPGVNYALAFFGYPLFLGLASAYWRFSHVARHHPAPNVEGLDADCDLMPYFAINEQQLASGGPLRQFYYRHLQWLTFPPSLAFNALNFQQAAWRYLFAQLANPRARRTSHWIDLSLLVAHWVLWLALPMLWFAPVDVLIFNALRVGSLGYGMFAVLAPGHFPAEAAALTKAHASADRAWRQCAATVNFRTGPIGRLFCSGLEYQIEHHLFPDAPHVSYREMSGRVREFCLANGYPYHQLGWPEAIWKSYAVFFKPKPMLEAPGAVAKTA